MPASQNRRFVTAVTAAGQKMSQCVGTSDWKVRAGLNGEEDEQDYY
jgi:hypothetical protein